MDDLLLAQKIICNKFCNINSDIYHENSFVYLFTNEKIKLYQKFMKNRKNSLSIISSGDQVLNLCLECSNIDCFDISRFPKYLLELKKALILSLNYDDYIEFFFNSIHYNNEKYDDFYYESRINLDKEYRDFWDGLFNYFDWTEICNSTLFSSQTISLNQILEYNTYLSYDNYNLLKSNLKNVNFNYYISSIQELFNILNKSYDFINLSSIIYYVNNYKDILSTLKLNDDGIALTYLYKITTELINNYNNCSFCQFENNPEGVMILKK